MDDSVNKDEVSANEPDSKPANRFEVLRVRQQSVSTDQPADTHQVADTLAPPIDGESSLESDGEKAETPAADEAPSTTGVRKLSVQLQPPVPPVRARHVSVQSNGDTTTSLDHDPNNSITHDTYRKFDTTNLKTFGRNTHEAIPHMDFYRQTTSAPGAYKRPTLDELHEEKEDDGLKKSEKAPLVDHKDSEQVVVSAPKLSSAKFGWITGVLVRCLLNIWGVMLFLRLSWVVGQAGIGYGSIIILLSMVVTIITTLSMSAICTNGEVKGGGAYYMISRSLGPEFGGAIGIIFSLANAIAVAMYVVGFAETVRDLLKAGDMLIFDEVNDVRIIGVTTVTFLLCIAIIGMEWEARAQLVLLVILLISIVNFLVGIFIPPTDEQKLQGNIGFYNNSVRSPFRENFGPDFRDDESFFSVFAIFFPAATGILAGANISGDLKNPSVAIPKGTLLAIIVTGITYIACLWLLGASVVRDASGVYGLQCAAGECPYGLMNSYRVMEMVSGWGPIIIAGIFAATLSSALASLVSAPKIFQAVCKDRIFPYIHVFGKGYGPAEEPRLSYFLTYIIAIAFVLIGDLNAIAPLISNFFLMSYTLINYSVFDASLSKSPGWRPSFKYYSMYVALAGAAMCLAMMFIIQWWAALITFAFVAALYLYVHYKKPDINWGSSTQAHVYKSTLLSALKLVSTKEHVKNFRPQILVFSGAPHSRPALVDFASNISKGISLLICGHVVLPTSDSKHHRKTLSTSKVDRVYELMNKRRVKGFYNYVTSPSLRDGCLSLLQTAGLGKLKPNTVMLGFKSDWERCDMESVSDYVHIVHDSFDANYGVGILRVGKGFDISHHISEDELIHASKTKSETKSPRGAAASPPHNVEEAEEDVEDEDEEFDEDEVAMTTYIGSKRLQRHKVPEINRFHLKQKKGTIDVWWLFDDGGLTLLIPHILSTKPYWQNCKLRVFLPGTKKGELNKEQKNMATLLSKFRIDYQDMEVIPTFGKKPSEESKRMFEDMISTFKTSDENGDQSAAAAVDNQMVVTEEVLSDNRERTYRNLRTRDLILEKSKSAALIVTTLPVPRKGQPIPLYMAWIDCLTRDLPAPTLLLRGNQESVLTFYS